MLLFTSVCLLISLKLAILLTTIMMSRSKRMLLRLQRRQLRMILIIRHLASVWRIHMRLPIGKRHHSPFSLPDA